MINKTLIKLVLFIAFFKWLKSSKKLKIEITDQDGDVSYQNVNINSSSSFVEFTYREADETIKSWMVFYNKNIQVFKILVFGEVDYGEPMVTFHCFLMYFDVSKNIIPLKELAVLNQASFSDMQTVKTNWTTLKVFNSFFLKDRISLLGDEIMETCQEASTIYVLPDDFQKIINYINKEDLLSSIKPISQVQVSQFPYCKDALIDWLQGCLCFTNIDINKYPCSSIPCPVENNDGSSARHNCGLKSCDQRHQFVYLVRNKVFCQNKY